MSPLLAFQRPNERGGDRPLAPRLGPSTSTNELEKIPKWEMPNSDAYDKDGVRVFYRNDMYPDFKGAGAVVDEVDIPNMQGNHFLKPGGDYYQARIALRARGYTESQIDDLFDPTKYTPHHFENQRTIQFVRRDVHDRFRHRGAVSDIHNGRPPVDY